MDKVLDAARAASRWEAGAPCVRGETRSDLGGEGTRKSCTLVARDLDAPVPIDPTMQRGAA
jgi:hypothetical protein